MDFITSETKSPQEKCTEAMQRGIDLLYKQCEFSNWREKILQNRDPIDVSSGAKCVLARIYGTSEKGFTALGGESRDFLIWNGFAPSAMFPGGNAQHTALLNATWNRTLGLTPAKKVSLVEAPVMCK